MKKSIKRLAACLLALSMTFGLAACGGNGGTPSAQPDASPSPAQGSTVTDPAPADGGKTYKVGFSNVWVGNSWGVQCVNELESYLKNDPRVSEYYITDANNDVNKQISDIQDLISKGVDLLMLQAISPDAVVPVIEEAKAKGITVVTCVSPVNTDQYDASVSAKDQDFGRVGMEWLAEAIGGKGSIIILNGMSGLSSAVDRRAGVQEVLDKYPDIKVLGEEYADWDYAKGKTATENLLAAFPQIDGVWSCGGDMTRGAVEAFLAAGRPLVPMTGEDNNGFLKIWKENIPNGFTSIAPSMPTWLFAEGARIGLDLLDGNPPAQKDTVVEIPVITQDELDKYVRDDLSDSYWANTKMSEADRVALYGSGKDGTQGLGGK